MTNTTTPTFDDARIHFEPTLLEIDMLVRYWRQRASDIRAVATLRGWIDFVDAFRLASLDKRLIRIRESIGEREFQNAIDLADRQTRRQLNEGAMATPQGFSAQEWAAIFPSIGAADVRSLLEQYRSSGAGKMPFGRSGL